MSLGELYAGYVQREIALLAVFELTRERVLHRHVQSDERRERLGDRHVADVVSRGGNRHVGGNIAHKTYLFVGLSVQRHPRGVGTVGADGVLTGVGVGERDGAEVIAHPRQFA